MEKNQFTPGRILARNTIYNLAGMVLPISVGIFAVPWAIRSLGVERFGILTLIWASLSYLMILDFGVSRATIKFTAASLKGGTPEEIPHIFWTSATGVLVLGVIGTLVISAVLPLLVGKLLNITEGYQEEALSAFRLLAYTFPFILLSFNMKGMLGAAQRFDLVNAVTIPLKVSSFLIPALAGIWNLDLRGVMALILAVQVGGMFIYLAMVLRIYKIRLDRPVFSLSTLKKLSGYGGWIAVTSIANPLLTFLDRFFIGSLISVTMLGYYSAPMDALVRLSIIPLAVMTTFFPEFSAGLAARDRMMGLFGKVLKFILVFAGISSITMFWFAEDILRIWLGQEFVTNSLAVFKIISLSLFVNFLAMVPFTFFQGIGRPDIPAKFHLCELAGYSLVLWVLIRQFGLNGAALAWGARVLVDFLLLYGALFKMFPEVRKFNSILRGGRILLLFILQWIILFLVIRSSSHLWPKIIGLIVLMVGAGYFVWKYILDENETVKIRSWTKRV